MWLGIRKSGVELLEEPLSSNTSRNSVLLPHEKKHMESILLIKLMLGIYSSAIYYSQISLVMDMFHRQTPLLGHAYIVLVPNRSGLNTELESPTVYMGLFLELVKRGLKWIPATNKDCIL